MLGPEEWEIVRLSLRVGAVSMLACLPVAFAIAWLLARRSFPGKALLDAMVHLPLVLPPVVTGWALLLLFGRTGPLGSALEACCGIVFAFRWTGAALAAAVHGRGECRARPAEREDDAAAGFERRAQRAGAAEEQ